MAVVLGNTNGTSGNTSSLQWSHTIAAGSNIVLLVGVALAAGESVSTVQFGATLLTQLRADQNTGSVRTEIFYGTGLSGTSLITVTPVTKARMVAGSADFSGGDTPDNGTGREEDAATSSSLTVTGDASDNYMFDILAMQANQGATVGANQTAYVNTGFHVTIGGAGSTQDGVDGGVMSWTFSSANIAHSACRVPVFTAPSAVLKDPIMGPGVIPFAR